MFDTTKDLRRVIIDTQQREKLVNNYRYRRQHNGADIQWWKVYGVFVTIALIIAIIIIIMLIAR